SPRPRVPRHDRVRSCLSACPFGRLLRCPEFGVKFVWPVGGPDLLGVDPFVHVRSSIGHPTVYPKSRKPDTTDQCPPRQGQVVTDDDLGFLDYADDVAIIVRFVEAKGDPIPQAVWRLDLSAVEWPHDTPARRLYGAIYRIEDGYTPSFALDVKESHSAWGAAGGFVEVVLTLAGG